MSATQILETAAAGEPADAPGFDEHGFDEHGAPFVTHSRDAQRFAESVRLARAFAMIENPEERAKVLDLAERLASSRA